MQIGINSKELTILYHLNWIHESHAKQTQLRSSNLYLQLLFQRNKVQIYLKKDNLDCKYQFAKELLFRRVNEIYISSCNSRFVHFVFSFGTFTSKSSQLLCYQVLLASTELQYSYSSCCFANLQVFFLLFFRLWAFSYLVFLMFCLFLIH